MSTIVQLNAENIKRLRAVEIRPAGSSVIVGGRNGQGKTSLLDSIAMALGGKNEVPTEPVRRGEERAKIVLETQDLIVTRRFTASGGTSLEVTNKEGLKFSSPQSVLDKLCASISFDPLAFIRADRKAQLAQLQALTGLSTADIDKGRKIAYEKRTVLNRTIKEQEAIVARMPAEGPARVSVEELTGELAAAEEANRRAAEQKALVDRKAHEVTAAEVAVQQRQLLIQKLQAQIVAETELLEKDKAVALRLQKEIEGMKEFIPVMVDTAGIIQKIRESEEINRKAEMVENRRKEIEALRKMTADSDALTTEIAQLDEKKTNLIASIKMPVPGLGCDEDGVTLNGLPLDQASSAEQLRVGLAIACQMNPELKVMLIRDGSLLDDDSLRLVDEMATTHGAQVWIERVGKDGHCSVVIEDGQIEEPLY